MWPKTITIKGIAIQVESLEELDEFVDRYGSDVAVGSGDVGDGKRTRKSGNASLAQNDRVMLKQFVERANRGILNKDLGDFLGASGKAIGPALRKWALHIKLAHEQGAQVFDRFSRPDGRGYKLTPTFLKIAQEMVGE